MKTDRPVRANLTLKQAAFLQAYIRLGNATKAAIEAGYKEKHAGKMSHRLLNDPKIRTEVEKCRKKLTDSIQVTFQDKVELLWSIAKKNQEEGEGDIAVKAIGEINKMMGHYAPEKSYNVNVNQNIEVKEIQEIRALYKKEM